MPLKINLCNQTGWKTTNPEIRGDILVLQFQDTRSLRILFEYAPKWEDIPVLLQMINRLADMETYKLTKKYEKIRDKKQ